jgi:DNA-binding response OmpR family regulator
MREMKAMMYKVMIAEDNILLADMLEIFLESEGYEVCGIASTVNEAVLLADLHQPDIAILDYRLAHGEFGSQICPLLEGDHGMGILYVSGDPLNTILTKADGDAYIQKPYGMNDLIRALDIIIEMKSGVVIAPSVFPRGFNILKNALESKMATA